MASTKERWPVSKAAGLNQEQAKPLPNQGPGCLGDQESPVANKVSIIYVDDQSALADLGQQMLKRLGYQVCACTSGAQALNLMQSQPRGYDLLISDMSMPGMTGLELAAACLEIRPDLKVIICTGHDVIPAEQDDAWRDLNIAALMNKPVGLNQLAATVRQVLSTVMQHKDA